jgi:hypothetical protein
MLGDDLDGADIGVLEGGGCPRFTLETLQSRVILREFLRART